ncbi:Hsp70 family protein [Luteibacter flocculans]|uniref:Hsp70 family protein n=1 Tax=Luteibacter flocculans TaxID=2780091 RepID=A0ABY4T2Z9_9GAMM|nr:Hsp70 family protein [Luteibacter flocculans]URL58243.1 Hsp70 family protein [Luteibacter flocculans]
MNIGIDFGTSYSAAATYVDGELTLVHFGDAKQFRTAVFFPEVVPDPSDFRLTPELDAQVESHVRDARAQQRQFATEARQQGRSYTERSDADLRRDALRTVRRQWMERRAAESPTATVESFQHALFGDDAVQAYLEYGDGNLIESPKSMLGYRLDPQVRKVIVHIATHILEHIRLAASRQLGGPVRTAVIGRPVHFRSSMGDRGSEQAVEIIREAAAVAGFDAVTFLEEPAAAAMHYHKRLATRQTALIVDIGGGTTDVAFAELGGDELPRIVRTWGLAKGGTDLDVNLSMHSFMPQLGNNVTRVPVHHYVEAASVHNLPKQREFRRQDYRFVDEPWQSRLRALQQPGATTRLNQTAERSKIALSSDAETPADLGFLEPGLGVSVARSDLDAAVEPFVERMQRLLAEVRAEWPGVPGSVFLTGGTSRSPVVKAAVRESFPDIPLVEGDPSLGVVSGLAVAAVEGSTEPASA